MDQDHKVDVLEDADALDVALVDQLDVHWKVGVQPVQVACRGPQRGQLPLVGPQYEQSLNWKNVSNCHRLPLWLKSNKTILLFYWLKMTFAKPLQSPHCENKLLDCGHTSFYLRCADNCTGKENQPNPSRNPKHTQSGSRRAILEGSPKFRQVAMFKWRLWVILPTAVLSSSADCTFSATGIVPLCLSSYQTHSRLLMPGIPLEPNISCARFFINIIYNISILYIFFLFPTSQQIFKRTCS